MKLWRNAEELKPSERGDKKQAAQAFMMDVHDGQRFKYVEGPYYFHPRDVAHRMHSVDEAVLGYWHDTVEHIRDKRFPTQRDPETGEKIPLPRDVEEAAIQEILQHIKDHFKDCGFDISRLIPELDLLTKRTSDTYDQYIGRIIAYAKSPGGSLRPVKVKKADLEDNARPDRNPRPPGPKDIARVARYHRAIERINSEFPESSFRVMKLMRISITRDRLKPQGERAFGDHESRVRRDRRARREQDAKEVPNHLPFRRRHAFRRRPNGQSPQHT